MPPEEFRGHLLMPYTEVVSEAVSSFTGGGFSAKCKVECLERLFYELGKVSSAIAIGDSSPQKCEVTVYGAGVSCVLQCKLSGEEKEFKCQVIECQDGEGKGKKLAHSDHWSMAQICTLSCLFQWGKEYRDEMEELGVRLRATQMMSEAAENLLPAIRKAIYRFTKDTGHRSKVSVGVSDATIPEGKIGAHEGKRHGLEGSIITIHPKALEKGADYTRTVLQHELVHYALSDHDDEDPHGELFQKVATAIGIPDIFQD